MIHHTSNIFITIKKTWPNTCLICRDKLRKCRTMMRRRLMRWGKGLGRISCSMLRWGLRIRMGSGLRLWPLNSLRSIIRVKRRSKSDQRESSITVGWNIFYFQRKINNLSYLLNKLFVLFILPTYLHSCMLFRVPLDELDNKKPLYFRPTDGRRQNFSSWTDG